MSSCFDSGANWGRKLFADSFAARIATWILLSLFVTGFLFVCALQVSRLFLWDEAGYGDTYVLYDVLQFQRSGVIYRDLTHPPYIPAAYSPLLYILYAVPGKSTTNPFFGPRLVALTSFILCVGIAVLLVRTLIPVRFAWLWGLLIAGSIKVMELWPLQLRGDFPAIFFSLLSIRLLLAPSPALIVLAGLCAGIPLQFKINYLAPLAAGLLWLALQKQWKRFGMFLASGMLSGLVPFVFFALREPRMVSQMLSVVPPVRDIPGCLKLIATVIREPVVLLALPALPHVIFRPWTRWRLLAMFIVGSFSLASLGAVQAGANVNYFFEALFALTPFAVVGSFRLIDWSRRRPGLALSAAVLIAVLYLLPAVLFNNGRYGRLRDIDPGMTPYLNRRYRMEETVLRGRHILSTNPRIALLDPHPALTEPFLVSHLRRLGKFDPVPLLRSIRNSEFEIVDVERELFDKEGGWRGIRRLEGEDFKLAIETAYQPECSLFGRVLRVPRDRPRDELLIQKLHNIGCVPEPEILHTEH